MALSHTMHQLSRLASVALRKSARPRPGYPTTSFMWALGPSTTTSPYYGSQMRNSCYSSQGSVKNTRDKVTIRTLRRLYEKGEPIAMLSAHDAPSALVADAAGIDVMLGGDSLGMVAMGLESTMEATMDEMLLHCRSVARTVKSAFVVSRHSYFPSVTPTFFHSPFLLSFSL